MFGRKAELTFLIVAPQVHGIDTEFCPAMISQMTFMFGIFLCSPITTIIVQLFMGNTKARTTRPRPSCLAFAAYATRKPGG